MAQIPDSELVLNPDGSIYHLHLRPEDLATTIITVGDPGRVERVSSRFDEIEVQKSKREFVTHTGRIGKKRITVLSTGIGPDNIDIVVNELDALVNINFETRQPREEHTELQLIRVGTSGGLQPDLPPGSLVAGRFGLGLDNLLHFYDYRPTLTEASLHDELTQFMHFQGKLPVEPYCVAASRSLLDAVGVNMHHGITITAPGFYGPQGRRLRLSPRLGEKQIQDLSHFSYNGIRVTNFEMETSALYALARMLGHRALSCNVLLVNRRMGRLSSDPLADEARLIEEVLSRVEEMEMG